MMAELNNASTVTKTRSDIRERLAKIVDLTDKIDRLVGFAEIAGEKVETSDDIMAEAQCTFVNIERESLLAYCNEQVLFLMKGLAVEAIEIEDCYDEHVKKAFSQVTRGYNEVKEAFDSFALMNRQNFSNSDDNLQKSYNHGKNIVEKLRMLTALTNDYFVADEHSDSRRQAIGQLAVHEEVIIRKEFETIRTRETVRDIRERLVVKVKRRAERKREEALHNEQKLSLKNQITELEAKCADHGDMIYILKRDSEQQEQRIGKLKEQARQQLDQINELTTALDEARLTVNTEQRTSKNLQVVNSNLEAKCADRGDIIGNFRTDAEKQEQQIAKLKEQARQQLDQINELTATLDEERHTMKTEQRTSKNLQVFISNLEAKCADQGDIIGNMKMDAEKQEQQIAQLKELAREQLGQINKLTVKLDKERLTVNTEQCNSKNLKLFNTNLEKEINILNKSLECAEEIRLKIQTEMTKTQIEMADIRQRNIDLAAMKVDYDNLRVENKELHEVITKRQDNWNEATRKFQEREEELERQLFAMEENHQIEIAKFESDRANQAPQPIKFFDLDEQSKKIEFESRALTLSVYKMQGLKKNQLGVAFVLKKKLNFLRRRIRRKIIKNRIQAMAHDRKMNKMKQAISIEKQRFEELNLKLAEMRKEPEDAQETIRNELERPTHQQNVLAKPDEGSNIVLDAFAKDMHNNNQELVDKIISLKKKNKKIELKNIDLEAAESCLKARNKQLDAENDQLREDCGIQLATLHQLQLTLKSLESQPACNLIANEIRLDFSGIDHNTLAELETTSQLQRQQSESMLQMLCDVEELLRKTKTCIDHVAPNFVATKEELFEQILDIVKKTRAYHRKCKYSSAQYDGNKIYELETKLVQLRQKAKDANALQRQFFDEWSKSYGQLFMQSQKHRHNLSGIHDVVGRICNKYKAIQLPDSSQQQDETVSNLTDVTTAATSLDYKQLTNADQHNTSHVAVKTESVKSNEPSPMSPTTKPNRSSSFITRPAIGNNSFGKTFGDFRRELLNWCRKRTDSYGLKVNDFGNSWTSGFAFCAIIHSYRPDLLNYKELKLKNSTSSLATVESLAAQLGLASDFKLVANCLKTKRPKYMNIMQFIEKLIKCLESQM